MCVICVRTYRLSQQKRYVFLATNRKLTKQPNLTYSTISKIPDDIHKQGDQQLRDPRQTETCPFRHHRHLPAARGPDLLVRRPAIARNGRSHRRLEALPRAAQGAPRGTPFVSRSQSATHQGSRRNRKIMGWYRVR